MEAMIDTAVHIGIPREMAKIMVGNTVKVGRCSDVTAACNSVSQLCVSFMVVCCRVCNREVQYTRCRARNPYLICDTM